MDFIQDKISAMKQKYGFAFLSLCIIFLSSFANAQDWPKELSTAAGDRVKLYQPQAESFANNILKYRSAIAIVESGKTEPVFGTYWATTNTVTDGDNRNINVASLSVDNIKFPGEVEENTVTEIKTALENQVPALHLSLDKSDLENSLSSYQEQEKLSSQFNNSAPKVIYSNKPAILVLIDGSPKLQTSSNLGVETVVNSPYTIVKNNDGLFYLYGGKRWYTAASATGPYSYTSNIPSNLTKIEDAVNEAAKNNNNSENNTVTDNTIPNIIVSTEPAELIQSNGEANFSPVEGTGLLFVKNSSNDIFMDIHSQQFFVLLSGRWYRAPNLNSRWEYIAADKLPADFAKIPEGSSKDNVLASVAGTNAAEEAVMDAQIPQTAKVNRKTASLNVTYDGDPEFENISGTSLKYAINSSTTVLKLRGVYYAVDNGIWFQSSSSTGPWSVSTTRPEDVDRIPASYPVYNSKYVYIYDVTPDYVYMGYTPGYLNTYIYGPTVVYGTGYYYRPWYRHYYYPRPYTWGFAMNYNPWMGWGIGFNYSFGWFNLGFYSQPWGYYGGGYYGWWGPSLYRPNYCYNPYRNYGYYGHNSYYRNNYYKGGNSVNITNNYYSSNVYRNRSYAVTRDNQRTIYNRTVNYNNRSGVAENNNYNRSRNNFSGSNNGSTESRRPSTMNFDRRNGSTNNESGTINNGRDVIANTNRRGSFQQRNSSPNPNREMVTGSERPSREATGNNNPGLPERTRASIENGNRRSAVSPQARTPQYRSSSSQEQPQRRMSDFQRPTPVTRSYEGSRQQMQQPRESSSRSSSPNFDRPSRSSGSSESANRNSGGGNGGGRRNFPGRN